VPEPERSEEAKIWSLGVRSRDRLLRLVEAYAVLPLAVAETISEFHNAADPITCDERRWIKAGQKLAEALMPIMKELWWDPGFYAPTFNRAPSEEYRRYIPLEHGGQDCLAQQILIRKHEGVTFLTGIEEGDDPLVLTKAYFKLVSDLPDILDSLGSFANPAPDALFPVDRSK